MFIVDGHNFITTSHCKLIFMNMMLEVAEQVQKPGNKVSLCFLLSIVVLDGTTTIQNTETFLTNCIKFSNQLQSYMLLNAPYIAKALHNEILLS